MVSNSEVSESDIFGSKSKSNLLSESSGSNKNRSGLQRIQVRVPVFRSSSNSYSSALNDEGPASWTLVKQQEAYKKIQSR